MFDSFEMVMSGVICDAVQTSKTCPAQLVQTSEILFKCVFAWFNVLPLFFPLLLSLFLSFYLPHTTLETNTAWVSILPLFFPLLPSPSLALSLPFLLSPSHYSLDKYSLKTLVWFMLVPHPGICITPFVSVQHAWFAKVSTAVFFFFFLFLKFT